MTFIALRKDFEIFLPRIGPSEFKKDNWGKVNSFDRVIKGPPIGARMPFRESHIFRSFHMVFEEGRDWTETPFFDDARKQIESGNPRWECRTVDEFLCRLHNDVSAIYESMKKFGFLTQDNILSAVHRSKEEDGSEINGIGILSLFAREDYPSSISANHEIKVGINEAGDILFLDGRHRLSIALILEIEAIPARVVFRHERWQRVYDLVKDHGLHDPGDRRCFVANHPDLERYPFAEAGMKALQQVLDAENLAMPVLVRQS